MRLKVRVMSSMPRDAHINIGPKSSKVQKDHDWVGEKVLQEVVKSLQCACRH